MNDAKYIDLCAGVRYWEDATINGIEDTGGHILFRRGENWCPVIRLDDGCVMGWPEGIQADIHYNVCDAGEYWLLDESRNRIAKYAGDYVPDLLSVGENGFGDYIIFKIGADGIIVNWKKPSIDAEMWTKTNENE